MITKIPLKILRIENDGHHIIIRGKINGKESFFIVDTGASRSVFNAALPGVKAKDDVLLSRNYPNAITLTTDEIPSTAGIINELQLGELIIYDYEATLIDMKHINELYRNISGKIIKGLIGNDLLIKHQAVIDYSGQVLILNY
jgi:predicted aspartyl protease